jgi:hypothetical protein
MKQCSVCHIDKFETEFYSRSRGKNGLVSRCKSCESSRAKEYSRTHAEAKAVASIQWRKKNRARYNSYMIGYADRLRNTIREAYGNKCACCGETEQMFLSIDHINNDGNLDKYKSGRRVCGNALYRRIINEGFSTNKYQLLCMNCNVGKRLNKGVCPHKTLVATR